MNSPRDLRRRIKSIGGTAQITRAMQMVAASKMRKAQQAAISRGSALRSQLYRIQRSATTRALDFKDPLQEVRDVRRRAVILLGGGQGPRAVRSTPTCSAWRRNFRPSPRCSSRQAAKPRSSSRGRSVV